MDRHKSGKLRETVIPNKLYFRIGEVSDIVGVKPYVLRYWESEFADIKPSKSKSGQRLYKRRDVETLVRIKELLYEERFTINGARKRLKDAGRGETREPQGSDVREEGPRQFEVFETMSAKSGGKGALNQTARSSIPRENSKVLIKIRKDLETLLHVVRQ